MKIKRRTIRYLILIILILLIFLSINKYINKDPYSFKEDSFSYSRFRGKTEYSMSLKEKNNTYDVYDINFRSKNFLEYQTIIYGLLFMPKNKEDLPGLIILPGGGVTKENEAELASKIADLGYAVLTIDQRGIGQTDGYFLSYEDDYKVFSQGKEPMQHLAVFDALKAFDVLRKIKGIDQSNIALAGESMGARYAIIAAAIEKNLKGVIVISTSGFHIKKDNSGQENNYYLSIDPDNYIDKVSPNKLFMFHGTNDSVVKLESAKITFDKAKEPKQFFIAEGCGHGYCEKMKENLTLSLKELFKK